MAHIRLDDKRIELSTGELRIGVSAEALRFSDDRRAGSPVLMPALSGAGARVLARSRAALAHNGRGNHADVIGADDNVSGSYGGVKVIFRSEPELVDADRGTRMIVGFKPSGQQHAPERAESARPSIS